MIGSLLDVKAEKDSKGNVRSLEMLLNIKRKTDVIDTIHVKCDDEGVINKINDIGGLMEGSFCRVIGSIIPEHIKGEYASVICIRASKIEVLDKSKFTEDQYRNKVFGRFGVREVSELKNIENGSKLLSVKVGSISKDESNVVFRTIFWNDKAEKYCNLEVGEEIFLSGRLQQRSYVHNKDGKQQVREVYEVCVSRVGREGEDYE